MAIDFETAAQGLLFFLAFAMMYLAFFSDSL